MRKGTARRVVLFGLGGALVVLAVVFFLQKTILANSFREAIQNEEWARARWLRNLGADPTLWRDTDSSKQLQRAVSAGEVERVKEYLAWGADPNSRCTNPGGDDRGSILLNACRATINTRGVQALRGQEECALLLIKAGARVNEKDNNNQKTPLHYAAFSGGLRLMRALIDAGANLDAQDYMGNTPLFETMITKNLDATIMLVEAKANVNIAEPSFGFTPLHKAISDGRPDAVKALLHAGADVRIADDNGQTPLDLARANCQRHPEIFQMVAEAAKTSATPEKGQDD